MSCGSVSSQAFDGLSLPAGLPPAGFFFEACADHGAHRAPHAAAMPPLEGGLQLPTLSAGLDAGRR